VELIANRLGWLEAIEIRHAAVARLRTFADLLTDGGFTVSQEGVANGVFILVTADAREDRKSNGQRGRRSQ
jgi:hypothetical protein